MQEPIFFLWTRSFWLGVLGVGALLAQDMAAVQSFADILEMLFDIDAAALTEKAMKLAPAVLFVAALQQRSGAARPYTTNPKAIR